MNHSVDAYTKRLQELGALHDLVIDLKDTVEVRPRQRALDAIVHHVQAQVGVIFLRREGSSLDRAYVAATSGWPIGAPSPKLPKALVLQLEQRTRALHAVQLLELAEDLRGGVAVALTREQRIVGALVIAGQQIGPIPAAYSRLLRDLAPRLGRVLVAGETDRRIAAVANDLNNALSLVLTSLDQLSEHLPSLPPQQLTAVGGVLGTAQDGAEQVHASLRELQGLLRGGRAPSLRKASSEPVPSAGSRILIVDDEPLIIVSLRRLLRAHHVTVASDGAEAIDVLRGDHGFDLVLCDLLMAGLSGVDFYDHLLQHHPGLVQRVMFMTGGAFNPEVRAFLSRVDNPVLHKPFDAKTVRWMVRRHLARHKTTASP